jgi:integrase
MFNTNQRTGDCKSSIIGSIPIRASIPLGGDSFVCHSVKIDSYLFGLNCPIDISIECRKSKISLKFYYKEKSYRIPLNCKFEELKESDICDIVTRTIRKADGDITIGQLLDWVVENDESGGALATRKKSKAHFIDLWVKREGRSLDESTEALLDTDNTGRTIPEQWAKKYGLPHKIRQIRSLFSKRNLLLFKREGWDTKHFANFVGYIAESTVSQPFTTDDNEVERIISFFEANRETHPVFYDIYLLAFGAGLRASEIYQVQGKDFTTFNGQHFLLLPFATKRSRLKNTNHIEKVGISSVLYKHFSSASQNENVIKGGLRLHKRFVKFLKKDLGITDNKACHRLRKILGARLATSAGIYHASKTLRNSVAVCERYYSDLTAHKNDLRV